MSIALIQSKYRAVAAIAVGLAAACSPAHASASEAPGTLAPISAFVQAGFGDQHTNTYVVGATWYLPWHFDFSVGTVAASVEASVGRWHTQGPKGGTTAWPTQLGAAPVLRLYPARASDWFGEIGIGPNYIVPIFHSGDKRFSTEFNFGDHAAIGRRFGASEVSLRIEHFSNAGISHPNPGENLLFSCAMRTASDSSVNRKQATIMKLHDPHPTLPVHDYSGAIQSAVSWLGNRYILAAPVAPRRDARYVPAFLLHSESWSALAKHRT